MESIFETLLVNDPPTREDHFLLLQPHAACLSMMLPTTSSLCQLFNHASGLLNWLWLDFICMSVGDLGVLLMYRRKVCLCPLDKTAPTYAPSGFPKRSNAILYRLTLAVLTSSLMFYFSMASRFSSEHIDYIGAQAILVRNFFYAIVFANY